MQYEVEVNGRVRQLGVHRVDGQFTVSLDGETRTVDVAEVDEGCWSLLIGAASYEAHVTADAVSGQSSVVIGSVPVTVALNRRRRWGTKEDSRPGNAGPHRIVAPMPGKIVRVLVHKGEAVSARQPLIVIEAMKMENELRASGPGVVSDLLVQEGRLVDAGTVLLVVAPGKMPQ